VGVARVSDGRLRGRSALANVSRTTLGEPERRASGRLGRCMECSLSTHSGRERQQRRASSGLNPTIHGLLFVNRVRPLLHVEAADQQAARARRRMQPMWDQYGPGAYDLRGVLPAGALREG
jgi:hypothetical protein